MSRFVLVIATTLSLLTPATAQTRKKASLADQLEPMIAAHQGDVGILVRHLESGAEFAHRADVVMPTASLCKLAVMVTAYRQAEAGKQSLDQPITLRKEDMVPGSGILTQHFSPSARISLRDAIRLMIVYSDNTATNLVADAIGLRTTSDTMTTLGFPETKIHSQVFRRSTSVFPERSRQYGLGSTTARETVGLLAMLHKAECASEESCEAMLTHLAACDDGSKLGANLPTGTRFAHKTGSVSEVRCDAGIMFTPNGPIAVCVLTANNKDRSWTDNNAANRLCARIGRVVFDHFNPPHKLGTGPVSGPLQTGAFGELVEMVQRTLNARLEPSPDLSVDGDFGPATESAVRKFQETRELQVTGIIDKNTFSALGTLIAEKPQPDPESVNSERLPVEPADPLAGAPFVTCRGYAVMDSETGELVLGEHADRQAEPASTTKIMTAWLVLRLAEKNPDVLNETLTFSQRADLTKGSTSGLRAGEKTSVREALFGLMLPSGNDMSVALAEHFGARLTEGDEDDDPLELFVEAMNVEAERLKMTQTTYRNPHGLPHAEHVTTPFDLARLARAAFGNELFRQYVRTRQHGVTVTGPGGYSRNVVWKNTNRLLGITGYDGVKTGTTSRAGACLVSTAKRKGKRLFLVVLGSASSASRYTDSRNLYRWAWKLLGQK